ncbi:MAG: hypothetical protein HC936_16540, partial [Leptolyngbyaceae cyanobacterium SU_3_3]|nr:hypothetical protein [Leptolyngbyaceae cyanobacterium SU_3_3]
SEDGVRWHSPPTTRQGRQGRIYYGTQVSSKPPTIALFVNDPALLNDNYRRYIERQFRQSLGFQGTPLRLLWRGRRCPKSPCGALATSQTEPRKFRHRDIN